MTAHNSPDYQAHSQKTATRSSQYWRQLDVVILQSSQMIYVQCFSSSRYHVASQMSTISRCSASRNDQRTTHICFSEIERQINCMWESTNVHSAISFSCQGQSSRSNIPTFVLLWEWSKMHHLVKLRKSMTVGFFKLQQFFCRQKCENSSQSQKIKVQYHHNLVIIIIIIRGFIVRLLQT